MRIVVGVMSLLIVVALGLVLYGFARNKQPSNAGGVSAALVLPKRTIIRQITGVDDYLALHVRSSKEEAIYLVDPRTGAIKSKMPIKYEK